MNIIISVAGCPVGQEVGLVPQNGWLSNIGIAMALPKIAIECNDLSSGSGLVSSWDFWPRNSFAFKTLVLRRLADGNPTQWTIIGTNNIPASDVVANRKCTYVVPSGDRIQVQNGDVIGVAQFPRNPLIAADPDSDNGTLLHIGVNPMTLNVLNVNEIFNLMPDGMMSTVNQNDPKRFRVSLSATVEEGKGFQILWLLSHELNSWLGILTGENVGIQFNSNIQMSMLPPMF